MSAINHDVNMWNMIFYLVSASMECLTASSPPLVVKRMLPLHKRGQMRRKKEDTTRCEIFCVHTLPPHYPKA
jgi:hypothetical protein